MMKGCGVMHLLLFDHKEVLSAHFYRGCQKNVPIEDRFSATNPYTAIIFSEHYYDKRYNCPQIGLVFKTLYEITDNE